jgi:hypothetical protein
MGGSQSSISQNNYQSISNLMQQVSNQQCINSCTDSTQLNITAIDTTFEGNITDTVSCQINNSSCLLKSALSTSITNSLASTQKGSVSELEGLFTLLQSLIGDNDKINQSNYQSIANEVSQTVNNTCRNDPTSNSSTSLNFQGSTIEGNISLNEIAGSSKAQCVLQNMSSIYANNSETNSQSASISKIDGLFAAIIAIVIAVVMVIMILGILFIVHPSAFKGLEKAFSSSSEGSNTNIIEEGGEVGEAEEMAEMGAV